MRLGRVFTGEHRSDAALRPVARAIEQLALGHDCDLAVVGKVESHCKAGQTAAEDHDFKVCH